jgi:N-acetylneuraminic acid mutarotase
MSPSSAVVEGKIYVIGGWDEGDQCLSTVEEYDPVTDTWMRKSDMPTGRDCLATVAVDGKIYAIGGALPNVDASSKTVEMYDPATDTWTRKADMPRSVWLLNASVVRGKIYALGGRPGSKAVSWVQEYDPATDTWTLKSEMPVGTSQMGSVVLGDKIVVIGGWLWSMNNPYTAVQVYDPETDIWTRKADVPFLRAVFSAEVVDNRIYAIGGTDKPHPCLATSTVYEFGPLLDFSGDGIVDADDMVTMIDHWGENYPLCDIGPTPLGDGIVDVQDLIVLAEHLFEEPGLVAYWKLDEAAGDTAHNSVGKYDGTLRGGPRQDAHGR